MLYCVSRTQERTAWISHSWSRFSICNYILLDPRRQTLMCMGKGCTHLYNTDTKCMPDLYISPQILMTPRSRFVATVSFRHYSYFCSIFSLTTYHSDHSHLGRKLRGLPRKLADRPLGPRVSSAMLRCGLSQRKSFQGNYEKGHKVTIWCFPRDWKSKGKFQIISRISHNKLI